MFLWRYFDDLLVLRIGLDLAASLPQVSIHLESGQGGERQRLKRWSFSLEQFGLRDQFTRQDFLGRGVSFTLPKDWAGELATLIKNALIKHAGDNRSSTPTLWLYLVKPYGYLGLIPWERLLYDAIDVPVARVPGFYSGKPAEYADTLDVAVCSSVPVAKGGFKSADLVRKVASAYSAIGRRITLHVFVDNPTYQSLTRDRIQGDANIVLYDPSESVRFGSPKQSSSISSSSEIDSPWLRWVSAAMPNRALDAVHFINHGYFSGDAGAIAFAQSPTENDDYGWSRFIGTAQLSTFLAQVGAWCALFTSPPNNYSVMGLRYLADDLAHQHPGPVVFHEVSQDFVWDALKSACQFVFDPQPAVPVPRSRDLFLYAPPSNELLRQESVLREGFSDDKVVQYAMARSLEGSSESTPDTRSLRDLLTESPNAPKWLVASERYLAKCRAESSTSWPSELVSMSMESTDLESMKVDEPASVSGQTLRKIQATIEEYARSQTQGGDSAAGANP